MRPVTLSLMLAFGLSAAPVAKGASQTPPDTTTRVKKPTSKLGNMVKKLADTAATVGAGAGVQSLLGQKAGGVASALGAAGAAPCGTGYAASAGSAIVGAAKKIAKTVSDTGQAASTAPCPKTGVIPGLPAGIPGMPNAAAVAAAMSGAANGGTAASAAAAAAAMAGGTNGEAAATAAAKNAMGTMASMTPIGLAAGAAPGAIKGLKGMLGGKPQDKIAMLRELGKGQLELKQVKFIEGTQEFEPGFEPSFAAFAEAIALVEGTYYMYVPAEASRQNGAAPDTVLSRKRVAKVWAAMAASGVSGEKVFAVSQLPPSLGQGRKLPNAGDARIEIIKFDKQP